MAEMRAEPEFDEEDLALQRALAGIQEGIDRHIRAGGRSIDDYTTEEEQALVDKLGPYIAFELSQSDEIWQGMPLVAEGPGGFLVADSEGEVCAGQEIGPRDSMIGIVEKVMSYPVPSLQMIIGSAESDEIPTYSRSMSAVVELNGAQFRSVSADGEMSEQFDLSDYRVLIPVTYGMRMAMAAIVEVQS